MNRIGLLALMSLAIVLAAALRLPRLDQRPMHGDEAIHAVKFDELYTTGRYVYDPEDYHGPTLYFFTFPSRWLSGAPTFADTVESTYRIVPVAFGLLTIALLPALAGGLCRTSVVVAAFLLAVSPGMTFYSRYYIQESLLAFFTLALLVGGWRYVRKPGAAPAAVVGLSAGLMHATKETCILAFLCIGLASILVGRDWLAAQCSAARRGRTLRDALIAIGVAAAVSITSHSAFFTNARGPLDSVLTYLRYIRRAEGVGLHAHPWHWYLSSLGYTHYAPGPHWTEALILLLAAAGAVIVLRRAARAPAGRFLALYAILLTGVYSAIPYKTPWCAVQFLWPMALLAGLAVAAALRRLPYAELRLLALAPVACGAVHLGWQAQLATGRYDSDNRNPYVYAHPLRDVTHAAAWVRRIAALHPQGDSIRVNIMLDDPWPLPWYLRGLDRTGYWESVEQAVRDLEPDEFEAPILIATTDLQGELDARLGRPYHRSYYGMRPDVQLMVYVEASLWRRFVQSQPPAGTRETPP